MSAGDVLSKLEQYYREVVTTTAKFDALRDSVNQKLGEMSAAIRDLEQRMRHLERERTEKDADLKARIEILSGHIEMLKGEALNAIAAKAFQDFLKERGIPGLDPGEKLLSAALVDQRANNS